MKNESVKEKRNIRLNVIDILLIVLLLLTIAGIVFRIWSARNPSVRNDLAEYEVYIKVENVIFTLPTYLNETDTVYTEDGTEFGSFLTNTETEGEGALYATAAEIIVSDGAGGYTTVLYPDQSRVDATGAILVKGIVDESGCFLWGGTIYLTPGETICLHTELVDFVAVIQAVEAHS